MLLSFLSLVGLAVACATDGPELHVHDSYDHAHAHGKREHPQYLPIAPTLMPPSRPLVWGDFNVIHTTDTHGWLLGHQKRTWPEPNYNGNLGDFSSFVTHMKRIAVEKDVDLLLIDSGDLHDGTGLSDGFPPGGVDAHKSNEFIKRLPYDLMSIGNHELYVYADTYDMYTNFVPHLNGRYLSSNVNIKVFNSSGVGVSVPVGNRSVTFTTRKGRKVTSLGVLYNFRGNAPNTTVQPVADMVKEQWFHKAIAEEPDVFVLVGHMPLYNDSWPIVYQAIRNVHNNTPILIFGGHSHIRDCLQYDGRSMALQSGRYMETIGWMSADLNASKGNTDNITFTRRYLDQNKVTYEFHTKTSNSTFDTPDGRSITEGLQNLSRYFDLDHFYGTAPQEYTLTQDPYPSNGSVLTMFAAEAAPFVFAMNNSRAGIPNTIIMESGTLRFNVFEGRFTKNDQLTAVPYDDAISYISNVTASIANQVLPTLNGGHVEGCERLQGPNVQGSQVVPTVNLTLGYRTEDACPGIGDDIPHIRLPCYPLPHYIGSNPPNVPDSTPIDLVFLTRITGRVVTVLNGLQNATHYTTADAHNYTSIVTNQVLGLYAHAKWN